MSKIEVNNDGPIKTIILNRPERNALDQEMLDSLYEIFSEGLGRARAIVLRGNGPSFCAGIDLAERQRRPSTGAVSPVESLSCNGGEPATDCINSAGRGDRWGM